MTQHNASLAGEDSSTVGIRSILVQMFVRHGFLGLLAFAWGFMLGGAVLMTAVTYGLAFTGFSHYMVTIYQLIVLTMLLPVAWGVMEQEYRHRGVRNVKGFGSAFVVALFFGCVMPVAIGVGAFVTWRDLYRAKTTTGGKRTLYTPPDASPSVSYDRFTPRRERRGTMGFMQNLQDLVDRSFIRLAH